MEQIGKTIVHRRGRDEQHCRSDAGLGERPAAQPIPLVAGALIVGVAALIAQALYVGILAFLGHSLGGASTAAAQTLGAAAYTGALALIVYPLARIGRRLTEKESPF